LKERFISLQEALDLTLSSVPEPSENLVSLMACTGFVAARDATAEVDSPSADVSMKDGYAIRSADTAGATGKRPVELAIKGILRAGDEPAIAVDSGTAVRILTGARIAPGADAVVAEEFVTLTGNCIRLSKPETAGRNILLKGSDVSRGDLVVSAGTILTPGKIGLLTVGGVSEVFVFRRPAVALIALGDELTLPGSALAAGKVYASNLVTLNSWCRRYGFITEAIHVPDQEDLLRQNILLALDGKDAIITSGGAWTGERDLAARVLNDLGWEKKFHRVRLGPGKAVGFGLLRNKPVFILPGGPPSNLVAFLQLVLPALQKLCGHQDVFLPMARAQLDRTVEGQSDWTQAIFGRLYRQEGKRVFSPLDTISRLKNIAMADALLLIPEGVTRLQGGEPANVQLLQ
jgi:molybdopterin molybdotransferase